MVHGMSTNVATGRYDKANTERLKKVEAIDRLQQNDNQTGQFGNQRAVNVVGARETVGGPVVQQSGIQCFNCKEFGHYAKECRKPKRVKDSTYHKEKMLLCKQAEKGVQLQAEQSDWLADTDEEIDEQELEAHYSYMAKIQEVPNADSGTDAEPLEQVQYDTDTNVFANDIQHFDQSESISNTCVVETGDSNVIPDSPDMCDNDIQDDQNDVECDDERVALANLIANLKLDVDENKKIQKQLKKANATLTQELTECKSILAETSRTLGESNSIRDSCLVALQNKQTEFERYKAFNDRTVDYDKLERKLKDTLGLLAQKDIDIQEGLKLKAYEISVVQAKHDELVKQSLITRSHYEGLVKEKTKVITDLKLKEEKDIDKMISMENQLKFLNEIVYKRSQSIQTIHMFAPKCLTFNGRPTFANPRYLKMAQNKHPRLYVIPHDQSDPANRLIPDREEILTLAEESRSKLNKDLVKPFDYTNANHDECVLEYLSRLNPRASAHNKDAKSHKTTKRYMPVEKSSASKKPERQIPTGHRFLNKKTTTVPEKTMNPRSCLRWQLTGRIFKTVGLRNQCQNGFTKDELHQMTSVHNSSGLAPPRQMTSDHNSSELGIHDHSNELSRSKLVPKVVPPADKTDTSPRTISQAVNKSPTHYPCDSARTFRVILFSIHNDEWKSFQCHHQTALRSYALSWKPCQGDSLNLPDHRIHKDGDGDASFQLKSDSLPHAHAHSTKTFYKHQDSRIMKAQELKTKTSANSDINDNSSEIKLRGRLLESFQDDAKYEHVGQDTRSQGGKDVKDKQG
ncbi:integrase, catalytic region, zinc finger, CCHC-type containing protein [Tanacetum coccineum]